MGILLDAGAEAAGDAAAMGGMSLWSIALMYAVLIGAMWFIFMRPQSKEKKRVASMLAALETGDVVMTTSGFYGTVIAIDENENTVVVEFGNNKNCRIPMDKSAISRVEKPEQNEKG